MTKTASEKSLWEYILLAVSGFATLVQLLGLISQSQTLFAQPSITIPFVVIVLVGTAAGCIFVLIRKKPGAFTANVPYYTGRQRGTAAGLLGTNVVVSMFVLGAMIWRPCLTSAEPIPPEKFGILVAHFTEGLDRSPTLKGAELTQRTLNALKGRLATSSLADRVEIREICAIRSEGEAQKAGESANASLVLWGNVAEFAQDTFEPSFTFVDPPSWPSDLDPLIFEVELNRVDSIELPSKISARATSIAAFVIGLIYLREGEDDRDYRLALREFSSAIQSTEPELETLAKGSEQELAIKRTLAIFYVLRGRAYAVLDDEQKALDDYSAAESNDPNYSSIYVARGNYHYGHREFSEAESLYRKALLLRETAAAHFGLGNSLFYLEQYRESEAAYLQAIDLIESKGEDPSSVRIVLGTVYSLRGEPELALEQLNQVVESAEASDSLKERAQALIASLSQPITTPTIASSTPQSVPTATSTRSPTPTPTATWSSADNTPTRKPKEDSDQAPSSTPYPAVQATAEETLLDTPVPGTEEPNGSSGGLPGTGGNLLDTPPVPEETDPAVTEPPIIVLP